MRMMSWSASGRAARAEAAVPVRQGILRAAVLLPAPAAEESAVQSKIAREKVRRAAVQYVPATAVLRALEVEKRVRDAAAAITVNRRATESI